MLNDILIVAVIFITRIALPVLVTLLIGVLLNRALHHEAHSAS